MLDLLKISVDGEKGIVVARDTGIRVIEREQNLALVRVRLFCMVYGHMRV